MPSLSIPVEAADFTVWPPPLMDADWDDLIWAAITVGRPNRYYVFRHGQSSAYEAIFRASLVRMAVEESVSGRRYYRTRACKSLDPSEKGAVNYFLGLTLCKLFADRQLGTPWLLHLDVFHNALNPQLRSSERSRPDLVGQLPTGDWIAFEAKGRVSTPDAKTKQKAKQQAARIVRVLSRPVTGHYAGISFFKNDTLSFFVQDPEPVPENSPRAIALKGEEHDLFRSYYEPFTSLMREAGVSVDKSRDDIVRINSDQVDAQLGMSAGLFELATRERWGEMRSLCRERQGYWSKEGLHPDGLWLRAGGSWRKPIRRDETHFLDDE